MLNCTNKCSSLIGFLLELSATDKVRGVHRSRHYGPVSRTGFAFFVVVIVGGVVVVVVGVVVVVFGLLLRNN